MATFAVLRLGLATAIRQRLSQIQRALDFPLHIPISGVALARLQHVIEKFFLLNRRANFQLCSDSLALPLFPRLYEPRQRFGVHFRRTKEMNMIWHDHVLANCPAVTLPGVLPFIYENRRHNS